MPTIDVTSTPVAALNSLSRFAGGLVQGHALNRQFDQRDRAHADDMFYREQLLQTRQKELEALARERDRQYTLDDRRVRVYEDDLADKLATRKREDEDFASSSEYVAKMTESRLGATNVAAFEDELAAQRAAGIRFAQGLSPRARALVYGGLDDDERGERAALAARVAKSGWESVLTNPLVAGDPGSQSAELQELAKEQLDALERGETTPAQSIRELEQLREVATKQRAKLRDFEYGNQWGMQQIAEGGGDIEAMNRAMADYETLGPENADLKTFQKAMLRAKHGLDMDAIKLGKIEVPRSIRVGSPEWSEIAESAADEEVGERMARDPWIRAAISDGNMSQERYDEIREGVRKKVLRGYAAKSGMTRAQMQARGWLDNSEVRKIEKDARAQIEKALRDAGIDPNTPVRAQVRQAAVTPEQRRREPDPEPEPELGSAQRPMLDRLQAATKEADDNTFGEEDIDAIYGEDG